MPAPRRSFQAGMEDEEVSNEARWGARSSPFPFATAGGGARLGDGPGEMEAEAEGTRETESVSLSVSSPPLAGVRERAQGLSLSWGRCKDMGGERVGMSAQVRGTRQVHTRRIPGAGARSVPAWSQAIRE